METTMDYTDTLPRLAAADDVLRDALGHLTTHCGCRGESLCVPCELAQDSWEESSRLRDLRARIAAFLEAVDHTLRCVSGYACAETSGSDCPVCAVLAVEAQEVRHDS